MRRGTLHRIDHHLDVFVRSELKALTPGEWFNYAGWRYVKVDDLHYSAEVTSACDTVPAPSAIPIPDPADPDASYKPLRRNMAAFGLKDPTADTEPPIKPIRFENLGEAPKPPADPWQHRSNTMKCATCMWFALKKPRLDFGRCRRHAPTLGGYPAVFSTDWCGDHKLDEGSLPQPGDSKP